MTNKKVFSISMLIAVTMCTVLWMNNASTQEELFWCAAISFMVVIFYMLLWVSFLSSSFFFLIFYIGLFYVQPIVMLITGDIYRYNFQSVRTLIQLIVLGGQLFILGNLLLQTKKIEYDINIEIEYRFIRRSIKWLIFISILAVILMFVDAGTFNILSLSRSELKNAGSEIRLLAGFLLYATSLLFFLVFFTKNKRSMRNVFFWIVFLILFELLIFIFFRTRSLMVVHFSAALVGLYYSGFYQNYSRIKKKEVGKKIVVGFLGVIVGALAIMSRFLRGFLEPNSNLSGLKIDWKLYLQETVRNGDLGYSEIVLKVINLVPNVYEHFNGQSYYRLLFTPIPRFVWPDKPINTETIVGGWLHPEVVGMSVPPGIIGDLYLNFGFLGILIMVFYGMIFALFDKKLNLTYFMFWAVSATWIFHLVRGGFTNPIMIMIFLMVNIYFVSNVIIKRRIVLKA